MFKYFLIIFFISTNFHALAIDTKAEQVVIDFDTSKFYLKKIQMIKLFLHL